MLMFFIGMNVGGIVGFVWFALLSANRSKSSDYCPNCGARMDGE